jgi:lactate racemase
LEYDVIAQTGMPPEPLSESHLYEVIDLAFQTWKLTSQKVLVIIPDRTRTAFVPLLFKLIVKVFSPRVKQLDFLVALGTHPMLSDVEIFQHIGLAPEEFNSGFQRIRIFNHSWQDPDSLSEIGLITPEETNQISGGLLSYPVRVRINRKILDYDCILVCGPVFPHEVVGFSGGNKYFFPGISSPEMIDYTHWLGALLTSSAIIGVKNNPVRSMIDKAASLIPVKKYGFCYVPTSSGIHGFFTGEIEEAWSSAVELSSKIHICYIKTPVKRVLALMPEMYSDLWVGGKGVYKTEPIVEDGGEVVIYAPHIHEVSFTHGKLLEQIGYHVRDYFTSQWDKFSHIPWGILAHSTHVRGRGVFQNGIETARITVSVASGLSRDRIEKLNLHYYDPASIDLNQWKQDQSGETLLVPHAGEVLFQRR